MLQARIRIDGWDYFLPPEHDAEVIMGRITEQVRAGGGFVEVVRTLDRVLNVLVSPGMNLSIELTEVDDQPAARDEELEQAPLAQSWSSALDMF